MSDRLGTAQWEDPAVVARQHPFSEGKFWLGRSATGTPIAYKDDRHICLISGTRGGKGTTIIINNLCLWPGSALVIDPKGENADLTAARRGRGDEYCRGMGQSVHVLDPFNTSQVDDCYRSSFNPLADLDPESEETFEEASRIANSIVVINEKDPQPMWDDLARDMVRGLILHVLTSKVSGYERNLITVRDLIQKGDWKLAEAQRAAGLPEIESPHMLLWRAMELNPAFGGVIAGIGTQFRTLMAGASKTYEGVKTGAQRNTNFIDSPGMRRVLAKSDFKLSELKTRPEGMTVYLCLPVRAIADMHSRWLRMMVALATTEMEITRVKPPRPKAAPTATGYPVLMVLDEFKQLGHMPSIESAVPYIAGFGVKMLFVIHSLEQLEKTYANWQTFFSCSGLKIAFGIEDNFTRDYLSKQIGDTEVIRETGSQTENQTVTVSDAETLTQNETRTHTTVEGTSDSEAVGTSDSSSWSRGGSGGINYRKDKFLFFPEEMVNVNYSEGWNSSTSESRGRNKNKTRGKSYSRSDGTSTGTGKSKTHSDASSRGTGSTVTEGIHRRPLIHPDEVGRFFARVNDNRDPAFPGLALVLVSGSNPFAVRRTHYFE